jgi:hypothetical protein
MTKMPTGNMDHFTGQLEAFLLWTATAGSVIKIVLDQIVPRFSLVENN